MFSDPEHNVLEFGFIPGNTVADLGSGAGHYAAALSKAVGPAGHVYAVDIDKEMLVRLKNDSIHEGRENIDIILGDIETPEGTKLRSECSDGAVFSNILFQLSKKAEALREAIRIVRPGGKICIVEWSDLSFLAAVKSNQAPVMSDKETRELCATLGLIFERAFEAGEHHYGLIFRK